jgi:hypothetical protein
MGHDDKDRDPLPDETASLEDVADFWATHDTTEYADAFVDVKVTFDIRKRHYQVDVQKDTFELLAKRAAAVNMPVERIIDEALRKELVSAP